MSRKAQDTIKIAAGIVLGVLFAFSFLTERSVAMSPDHAFTFAFAVSVFSISIIAGTALLSAYRFLKNVGVFRGHYYY